jgi:hypothetical protein
VTAATLWIASIAWAKHIYGDYQSFAIERDDAKRAMLYPSGVFIAGVAALGVSAYLYFGKGREREIRTTVVPVVDRNAGGVSLAHRF